jgi:hypothetical protein
MATKDKRSGAQSNACQPQYGQRNRGQQSGEYSRQYAEKTACRMVSLPSISHQILCDHCTLNLTGIKK